MPNVPNVPGVPALTSFLSLPLKLLTSDDPLLTLTRALAPWGIFLNGFPYIASSSFASQLGLGGIISAVNSLNSLAGNPIGALAGAGVIPAGLLNQFSIVDFSYKKESIVSDYQIEGGSFLSYNKVDQPFDIRMRVAAGGSSGNRQALIDVVEFASGTLDLYSVVTPEAVYPSCNIVHHDYRRTAQNGAGLVIMDIWLAEIRETAVATFSNTQSPTSAGVQGLGTVQPQAAPAAVTSGGGFS